MSLPRMKACFGISNVDALRNRLETAGRKRRFSASMFRQKRSRYRARAEMEQHYSVTAEVLGKGNFGQVRLAHSKDSGEQVAIKVINKRRISKASLPRLKREANVMRRIKHHSIVRLLDDYEDDKEIILVLELCKGRELYQELVESGRFSRKRARRCLRRLLEAVDYLHQHGICHRDIKLENIMCTHITDDLKLIDFGVARSMLGADLPTTDGLQRMDSKVGSVHYNAPQVLDPSCTYGKGCDVWAVGVIGYLLLTGVPPFKGKTTSQVAQSVKTGRVNFACRELSSCGADTVDLLRQLLCTDESRRLTAREALQHRFFADEKDKEEVDEKENITVCECDCTNSGSSSPAIVASVPVPRLAAAQAKDELVQEWVIITSPMQPRVRNSEAHELQPNTPLPSPVSSPISPLVSKDKMNELPIYAVYAP